MQPEITPDVSHALGHYVYAYVDPRDGSAFYIGKGVGTRATSHLSDSRESRKVDRIREIQAAGLEPRIDIVAWQLRDDDEACRVEAALICMVGLEHLTNAIEGQGSVSNPRRPLNDIIAEQRCEPVTVIDPALLIRVNREFRYDMAADELLEFTRGIWVIGERRSKARLAMAVYAGIVREVYLIDEWHRAGSTPYMHRNQSELAEKSARRWEFTGRVADDSDRIRYRGRSVDHYFQQGQQSPVVGVLLD